MLTQECLQDAVKYGECFIKFGKTAEYIPELARVNKYHLVPALSAWTVL